MTEDKGEPIEVPKVCLYMILLNVKYVKNKTNFTADINSFMRILVFFSISVRLLKIFSIARFYEILVKEILTSKDIKISTL